jgi:hypothetical protein
MTITEEDRQLFIGYAQERITKSSLEKNYNHLTDKVLNKTFTFFVDHKLTATNKSLTYWFQNSKKTMECYGYSGSSAGTIDNEEDMKNNLYHEIFCYAEWIGRSIKENYSEVCKDTIGNKNYKLITATN